MKEWIIEALHWVATVTDAYFATTLPQETWELAVETLTKWCALALEYFEFLMQYIGG